MKLLSKKRMYVVVIIGVLMISLIVRSLILINNDTTTVRKKLTVLISDNRITSGTFHPPGPPLPDSIEYINVFGSSYFSFFTFGFMDFSKIWNKGNKRKIQKPYNFHSYLSKELNRGVSKDALYAVMDSDVFYAGCDGDEIISYYDKLVQAHSYFNGRNGKSQSSPTVFSAAENTLWPRNLESDVFFFQLYDSRRELQKMVLSNLSLHENILTNYTTGGGELFKGRIKYHKYQFANSGQIIGPLHDLATVIGMQKDVAEKIVSWATISDQYALHHVLNHSEAEKIVSRAKISDQYTLHHVLNDSDDILSVDFGAMLLSAGHLDYTAFLDVRRRKSDNEKVLFNKILNRTQCWVHCNGGKDCFKQAPSEFTAWQKGYNFYSQWNRYKPAVLICFVPLSIILFFLYLYKFMISLCRMPFMSVHKYSLISQKNQIYSQ